MPEFMYSVRLYNIALNFIFFAGFPILFLFLLQRSKLPRPVKEVFGFYPSPGSGWTGSSCRIWLQASSVGEVGVALPFIRELITRLPDVSVLLTVSTPQGMAMAKKIASGMSEIAILYYPWDLRWSVKNALKRWRPNFFIPIETEIWPNFIFSVREAGAKVIIANGRISDKSFPRYMKIKPFIKGVMECIDLVLSISEKDAERFYALGVPFKRIKITGNIKMDIALNNDLIQKRDQFLKFLGISHGEIVFIAGSTRPGEEKIILEAVQGLDIRLIIAPRHMDRIGEVIDLSEKEGKRVELFSSFLDNQKENFLWDILVIDTIGHLMALYGLSQIAFIGGSLKDYGGQNMLEPAIWGIPVIFGPYTQNFRDEAMALEEAGGAVKVTCADELRSFLKNLILSSDMREVMGAAARKTVGLSNGAIQKHVDECIKLIENRCL